MRTWTRHPADRARLAASVLVFACSLVISLAYSEAASRVSADLVALVANLPTFLERGLLGAVQLAAVLTPVVLLAIAVRWRRPTQAGDPCLVLPADPPLARNGVISDG